MIGKQNPDILKNVLDWLSHEREVKQTCCLWNWGLYYKFMHRFLSLFLSASPPHPALTVLILPLISFVNHQFLHLTAAYLFIFFFCEWSLTAELRIRATVRQGAHRTPVWRVSTDSRLGSFSLIWILSWVTQHNWVGLGHALHDRGLVVVKELSVFS